MVGQALTISLERAPDGREAEPEYALQVSVRTWAVLHHRLRLAEKAPQEAATAILLRGLMELCIYGAAPSLPRDGRGSADSDDADGEHLPVPWSCTDDALMQVPCCEMPLRNPAQRNDHVSCGRTSNHVVLQCVWLCCKNIRS